MCGRRLRRFFIISFFLFCSLQGLYSEDLSAVPTVDLVKRLTEISEERRSLQSELQISLGDLRSQSELLETGLDSLSLKLQEQGSSLERAQDRLTSLEEQLTAIEGPQEELRKSLSDMTNLNRNLSESFRSYSEEQERQVSSLKNQNIILTLLTVIASGIALTALIMN